MRNWIFAGIILAALCVVPSIAKAQSVASITGLVTDSSGAAVPGASVRVSNPQTGAAYFGKTAGDGTYRITDVTPGPGYAVTVSKDGFETLVVNNLYLSVGAARTQDMKLALGTLNQTVQVTAPGGAGSLDTTDATIGTVVEGDRVQDLPSLFVNNAASFLELAPGVQSTGDDSQQGVVTGTRGDQANITLDGLDINDQRTGQAFVTVINTPLDSIQEVSTIVGGDDASYGHSAGGQVQLVTKSGTNNFHGEGYEFNRVTALAANNFFNNLDGIPQPGLIRNQFGGDIGGPILKDRLFFFFTYNGLRQNSSQEITDIVPVNIPQFENGQLNYVNNGAGCGATSNLLSAPNCISTTPVSGANSLAALDPADIGANPALLSLLASRYSKIPKANDPAVGDLVNTEGFLFTAPVTDKDNTFVGKLDYQISKNNKLFARSTWDRSNDADSVNHQIEAFPGDPAPEASIIDHSRSWVVGETWTASPNVVNQASFGETDEVLAFALSNKPNFPNLLSFFFNGNPLTSPFDLNANGNPSFNEQFVNAPIYQIRDNFTWTRGKHTLEFGGVLEPTIFKSGNLTDTNVYSLGLGGGISSLGTPAPTAFLRPSNLSSDAVNVGEWDPLFALILGREASITSGYNYDLAGNALPQGTVPIRDFHSTQYEFYAQDVWNIRSGLTMTYGLRWEFHNPLSEVNGFEAVPSLSEQQIFSVREADAAAGIEGPNAVPFVTYSLGGSANHAPGYYRSEFTNFAPRLGIAYSPSYKDGFLGRILGDRKTSIRTGFGINYDDSLLGQGFTLDELSFLFSNSLGVSNGSGGALQAFEPVADGGDPRFAGFSTLQPPPPGGVSPRPSFTPNVDANGIPIGFSSGNGFGPGQAPLFNYDPGYKSPYEMSFSFGFQRELPSNWQVDVGYFGKLGRRLTALGDPAQTLNFKDAGSGQFLYTAFGNVETQLQQGTSPFAVTNQPWFENQMTIAAENAGFGTCANEGSALTGGALTTLSCTHLAAAIAATPWSEGDTSSTLVDLALIQPNGNPETPLIPLNVGLLAQDGAAGFVGNFASSNYNALLVRLTHRMSSNLAFEFDYAYAHSIDNDSDIQNELVSFAAGEVCDLRNLRVCRGNSNFDAKHTVAANYEYGLPFGRGQRFGHDSSKLLDEVIGGWKLSGIVIAHTGFPFKIDTGTFPIDFTQTAPAVFIGTQADVKGGIHEVTSPGQPTTLQYFANPTNALGAFAFPFGGGTGDRNVVRGPGYWNTDFALLKNFTMPWSESHLLQFRLEAFNLFNHPDFNPPSSNSIAGGDFGAINSTVNAARQVQLALKYTF